MTPISYKSPNFGSFLTPHFQENPSKMVILPPKPPRRGGVPPPAPPPTTRGGSPGSPGGPPGVPQPVLGSRGCPGPPGGSKTCFLDPPEVVRHHRNPKTTFWRSDQSHRDDQIDFSTPDDRFRCILVCEH